VPVVNRGGRPNAEAAGSGSELRQLLPAAIVEPPGWPDRVSAAFAVWRDTVEWQVH